MAEKQLLKFFYKKFNTLFEYASEFETLHMETCNLYQQMLETYQVVEKLEVASFSEQEQMERAFDALGIDGGISGKSATMQKGHMGEIRGMESSTTTEDKDSTSHFDFLTLLPQVLTNLQTSLQFHLQSLQTKLIIQQVEKYDTLVENILKLQHQVEVHYVTNQEYFQVFAREKYQYGIVRFISRYLELLHLISTGYLKEKTEKCEKLKQIKEKMQELAGEGDSVVSSSAGEHDEDDQDSAPSASTDSSKSYFMRLIQWMERDYNDFIEYHHVNRAWVNELVNLRMEDDKFDHLMHSPAPGNRNKRRKVTK